MASDPLTKTLIVEIALPEFYAEDFDDEVMRDFYGDEDGSPLTPEQMLDAVSEEAGMITGGHVRVLVLTGSKGGNELQRMDGWIVGARVVPREPDHERKKDERLDDYEERWAEDEVRRLRNAMTTKDDTRAVEMVADYVAQLEALDAERYEAQRRLAQVLGWGDFRECSAGQTEQFAAWAKEVGLPHLGNPHIRKERFAQSGGANA